MKIPLKAIIDLSNKLEPRVALLWITLLRDLNVTATKSLRTSFLLQKVEFHSTFSRHGITEASSILLIWLNENVHVVK